MPLPAPPGAARRGTRCPRGFCTAAGRRVGRCPAVSVSLCPGVSRCPCPGAGGGGSAGPGLGWGRSKRRRAGGRDPGVGAGLRKGGARPQGRYWPPAVASGVALRRWRVTRSPLDARELRQRGTGGDWRAGAEGRGPAAAAAGAGAARAALRGRGRRERRYRTGGGGRASPTPRAAPTGPACAPARGCGLGSGVPAGPGRGGRAREP